MNLHGVYHQPNSNYAYAYDKETLHLRLRTVKGEVERVVIRSGDPYLWLAGGGGGNLNAEGASGWACEESEMKKEASTDLFDFWIVEIKPPFRRLRYGFILFSGQEQVFYGENQIVDLVKTEDENVLEQIGNYFCFPFLNGADVFQAPEWVKSTVWYQIFPERFNNGNMLLNPEGTLEWGSCDPTGDSFFGGDLQGIMDKLDYLQELGINGIYLCPIFTAPSTHKYDTSDYFEIDPQFGDKETFKKFVEMAHERGIKVMLDAVFNHCGAEFEPWKDVLKYGENSSFKDWFHIRKFPLVESGQLNYDAFAFVEKMPKMNTENPEVLDYFLQVGRYWVSEFDIDGWRLDVANEVDHAFWRIFRKELKEIKSDIYILGEIWHDSRPWLQGDQFDAVMNYPLSDAVIKFIAKGKLSSSEFMIAINKIRTQYMRSVSEVNFNLLDSHDTERLLTVCKGDKDKALLAYTFLMTQTGSACLYYGSEIALDGGADPLCRRCMIWDEKKQDLNFYAFLKKLIKIRREFPAMSSHDLEWIEVDDEKGIIIFQKTYQDESIYVVLNNQEYDQAIDLSKLPENRYTDLLTDKSVDQNQLLLIKAYSAALLK